jgi:hypothetical protein
LDGTVKGVTTLVFNSATIASFLIFLSGNRYNLDKVAAKHIATSFRFATCTFLLLQIVALDTRKAYLTSTLPSTEIVGERIHFTQAAAVAVFALIFCTALLLDCVPHLPATAQFLISVSASHLSPQTKQKRNKNDIKNDIKNAFLTLLQGSWCAFFGMGLLREMRRISSGQDSDCFLQIGVYRVCEATLIVSNYGNLMLLMAQAIVSRMLVPGKSNFVTASVRRVCLFRLSS